MQVHETRRTQAERSATTMEQLLTSARKLFAEQGYAAASLTQIVADAGLTKGAVYHHYVGKEEVFRAVYEREQEALVRAIAAATRAKTDPWDRFLAGWHAFLRASQEPVVQRITLIEAPIALGWEQMRAIGTRYTLALVETGLTQSMDAGRIVKQPVQPLARLLFAAMCEASMLIAGAPDPKSTHRQVSKVMDALLKGLEISSS